MIIDNNPFYIVAKKFDEIGCIAYKCKNMNEARNVPNTLQAIRAEDVQIVILDDPEIYSEYAPYKYVDDLREFMNQAGNLNLVVQIWGMGYLPVLTLGLTVYKL